jgi:hypothetical protein
MTWTHKSHDNGWVTAQETITTVQDQSTVHLTSEIDFLPPDQDFLVTATANNLSDSGRIDLYVAAESGGTYVALKTKIIQNLDNSTKSAWYDVSSYGIGAYNKLGFYPDGAQDADDTIQMTVYYRDPRLNKNEGR